MPPTFGTRSTARPAQAGRCRLASCGDEPGRSQLGDRHRAEGDEAPVGRVADQGGDFGQQRRVVGGAAAEFHRCPPAAQDGLRSARDHCQQFGGVQLLECRVWGEEAALRLGRCS